MPPEKAVEELYLAAFARRRRRTNSRRLWQYLTRQADTSQALEDLLWVLLNTQGVHVQSLTAEPPRQSSLWEVYASLVALFEDSFVSR